MQIGRITLSGLLIGAAGLAMASGSFAANETVTIAGFGGNLQKDLRATLWQPAADKAGLSIAEETHDGLAAVRVQVQSGSPTWDLVHLGSDDCAVGGKEGLFEPLDYNVINTDGFDKRGYGEHWIATNSYSVVLAWRTDVYKDKAPQSWKDLWDTEKFPGRRALSTYPQEMLEVALMADGVPKDELYPLDSKRAFRSLDKIKSKVAVWWSSGAQSSQLIKDGEVDMMAIWGSRVASVIADGAPVSYTYQDAILGYGCLAILKGAPHVKAAQTLVAGVVSPEIQARIPEMMPYYGPTNSLAFQVGKFSQEVLARSNMSPENLKKQVFLDANWWRDNTNLVREDYSLLMAN
ncbi:ABC transporter substrate-binding protein [Phyllobacterium myrsinacearum]|uniref:Putative spermidine/putrescine transport system substrate-binding protein n=1 Tax=Phyllobacterium myrsinacearum TaxID=28101 RepID=A0A839ESU3_9HYPH|nr:ABC transporter substrate-binding protein [Phyllobacterium myrsinacearum]MBA8881862.1 putative spermidine/putrescine transport system substrate-binding protein [Phyllobacterium myrsinacearum]